MFGRGVVTGANLESVTLSPPELLPGTLSRDGDVSVASKSDDPAVGTGEMDVPADDNASGSGGEQEEVKENGKPAARPVVDDVDGGPSCDG